jgi:phosphomannomutase
MNQTVKKQFIDNKAIFIRPSRTEPVFMLYAEAKNQEKALKLVKDYTLMLQKSLKPLQLQTKKMGESILCLKF